VAGPLLRQPHGGGVLIVGNSPPDLPLDATSPLYDLLDFPGHGTTARRRDGRFARLLRRLDDAGVRVVYLFLEHDRCNPEEVTDLHDHRALHEKVRLALEQHVQVIPALADAEGIAQKVGEALQQLSEPQLSGVACWKLPPGGSDACPPTSERER